MLLKGVFFIQIIKNLMTRHNLRVLTKFKFSHSLAIDDERRCQNKLLRNDLIITNKKICCTNVIFVPFSIIAIIMLYFYPLHPLKLQLFHLCNSKSCRS